MGQKIFCVGLNGKPGNLQAILERFASEIHEVFAAVPPSITGSGRAGAVPLTFDKIAKQVETSHATGVGYNALLNAICLGGRQFQPAFQRQTVDFFEFADQVNIDALTIAEPFLLHKAVEFRESRAAKFTICVSSLADITDVVSAKRYEQMGAGRIILHQNVNRDFPALREILDSTSCEIELYANTGSLYKCPYRQAHRAFISHLSTLSPEDLEKAENHNWFKENCIAMRKRDPLEIVKAPTIRPEDISFYEKLGIRLFKISSRSMTTRWTLGVLNAYVNRTYDSSIADLCDTNLGRKMPQIPNTGLEGLLESIITAQKPYEEICKTFLEKCCQ